MSQPQLFHYQSFRTYSVGTSSVSCLNLAGLSLASSSSNSPQSHCSTTSTTTSAACSPSPKGLHSFSSRGGDGWGSTETRKAYTSLHSLSHHTTTTSAALSSPLQQQQQDDEEEQEDDSVGFDMDMMELEMDSDDNFW
jgi:hypothetical protein